MKKSDLQSRFLAFAVVVAIIFSLGTYTFAATANVSASEETEEGTLAAPVQVEEKVNIVKDGLEKHLVPGVKTVITVGKEKFEVVLYDDIDMKVFTEFGIEIGENDYYTQEFNSEENVNYVNYVSVEEKEIEETEVIKSSSIYINNPYLYSDQKVTVQKGSSGEKKIVYKVRYENGVETSKIMISEMITKVPVDSIVEIGTKQRPKKAITGFTTMPNEDVPPYKSCIIAEATAYDLSYESCGKNPGDRGYGITASGMQARYGVVAVDPRVIPLGTKLYITSVDGSWTYGEAIAGDTGGAIKGNRVDLFFNTRAECMNFGRRQIKVYILE